jgi:hypothetical protein
MTVRWLVATVSALLLVAGLIGMALPVTVPAGDGVSFSCGNAFVTDLSSELSAARAANERETPKSELVSPTAYVAECRSLVSDRRVWTIPLVVVGVIGVAVMLLGRRSDEAATP